MMGRGDIASVALLPLAAAIVLWVRLVPLSLPAVPERAAARVRAQIGVRLAAQRADASSVPKSSTGFETADSSQTKIVSVLGLGLRPIPTGAERQAAVDGWIAAHPEDLGREVAAETARLTAALQYEDDAGRRRPFLGDYDSYTWLRAARNYLRAGTVCDAVTDRE